MKNKLMIYITILILTMTIVSATHESIITPTGTTIDLTHPSSPSVIHPKGYAEDANNNRHYILTKSSSFTRYNSTFENPSSVFGTSGIAYFGIIYNTVSNTTNFITRTASTNIRQLNNAFGNMVTLNINSYIPMAEWITNIADIEIDIPNDRMYIVDSTGQYIHVFSIDYNGVTGFLNPSYLYRFDTTQHTSNTINHIAYYDDSLYLYDETGGEIYRTDVAGNREQSFLVNTSTYDAEDIFFYNNSLYIIDSTNDIAIEYDANLIEPPVTINGYEYDPTSCTGNYINNPSLREFTNNLCLSVQTVITPTGDTHFYCEINNTVYCPTGCTQTYDDTTFESSGACNPQACTNECDIINQYVCQTENTYAQCVLGSDGCLDLVGGIYCPINQYCSDGQCDSVTLNKTGLWTQEGMIISADVNSTNAYERTEKEAEIVTGTASTIIGLFSNPTTKFITQQFYKSIYKYLATNVRMEVIEEPTDKYTAVSCDFTNNLLEQDYLNHNSKTAYRWTSTNNIENDGTNYWLTINSTTPTSKELKTTSLSQELEILIEPRTTGTTNITYYDNTYIVDKLQIIYNSTAKNLIVKEVGYNKVIVNDTSLQPSDDLQRIVIVSRHMKNLNSNHYEIYVIRKPQDEDVISRTFSLSIQYTNNLANTPTTISFTGDGTARVYQVLQREQDGFTSFEQIDSNETGITECAYFFTGCKNVRVWGNNQPIPTYHFYDDVQVCPTTLQGQNDALLTAQAENAQDEQCILGFCSEGLTLGLAIILLSVTVGATLYLTSELETQGQKTAMFIGGFILFGLEILYFSQTGVFPEWYIGLLIMTGVTITGFLFIRNRV